MIRTVWDDPSVVLLPGADFQGQVHLPGATIRIPRNTGYFTGTASAAMLNFGLRQGTMEIESALVPTR